MEQRSLPGVGSHEVGVYPSSHPFRELTAHPFDDVVPNQIVLPPLGLGHKTDEEQLGGVFGLLLQHPTLRGQVIQMFVPEAQT